MRELIVKCDNCKKEILGNPIGVFLQYIDRDSGEPLGEFDSNEGEICESCARKIMMDCIKAKPLKKKPTKKPTKKPGIKKSSVETDPEVIKVKGQEIDSFRRAGRTWEWISDETRVTVKTLRKIYSDWKKELEEKQSA